jgi:hypothetical protein
MDQQGIDFAERVRIRCTRALLRLGNGHHDDAIQIISDLCGEAEQFVHGANMAEEVEAGNYDLAGLRVNLNAESPEIED